MADTSRPETDSERAVNEANALQAQHEAMKAAAEARKYDAEADLAELNYCIAKRRDDEELAKDRYHHLYLFSQSVGDSSVQSCMDQLTLWSRRDPGCDMEIVFNSPGGSVVAGLALFDFVQGMRRAGHNVTTSTIGMAASMAGILLQAGDVRVMGRESWLLIHEAAFMAGGKIGEVEDTVEWVKKISKRVLKIFASRSKMTTAQVDKKWKRRDWWLDSDEALKLGLIDEVR